MEEERKEREPKDNIIKKQDTENVHGNPLLSFESRAQGGAN